MQQSRGTRTFATIYCLPSVQPDNRGMIACSSFFVSTFGLSIGRPFPSVALTPQPRPNKRAERTDHRESGRRPAVPRHTSGLRTEARWYRHLLVCAASMSKGVSPIKRWSCRPRAPARFRAAFTMSGSGFDSAASSFEMRIGIKSATPARSSRACISRSSADVATTRSLCNPWRYASRARAPGVADKCGNRWAKSVFFRCPMALPAGESSSKCAIRG